MKYASDGELYKGVTYREEEILKSQLSELVLKAKHDSVQFFNTLTFAEQDHAERREKLLLNVFLCLSASGVKLRLVSD